MKRLLFVGAMALTLAACANSSLLVEQPNSTTYRTSAATIEYDKSNVAVDAENIAYTQRKMEEAFFGGDEPLFDKGQGLKVVYRYVAFDEGSRFGRYMLGGITGGSKVVLEVVFVNPDGPEMATVRGEGTVSGDLFGGSNKSGIDKAIDEVAEYASAEFHS